MALVRKPMFGFMPRRGNYGTRWRRGLFGGIGGASFPATGILDNFNRTNEGPPPSASYTTPEGVAGLNVIGNAIGGASSDGYATWNTSYATDQENALTLTVPPLNGQAVRLMVRQQSATLFRDCYYAEFVSNTPAPATLRIWKRVVITDTQLGADITLAADLTTQQLGIRVMGTTITAYLDGFLLGTRTDGDVAGAGRLMINFTDTTTRGDNFRGGAV